MRRQKWIWRLVLVLAALCLGVLNASAQSKASGKPPWVQEKTITDAAGRVHKRTTRITHAQRKAVAERQAKARRLQAAQKKGEVKR